MKPLPLDIINASAPYEVYWHESLELIALKVILVWYLLLALMMMT